MTVILFFEVSILLFEVSSFTLMVAFVNIPFCYTNKNDLIFSIAFLV